MISSMIWERRPTEKPQSLLLQDNTKNLTDGNGKDDISLDEVEVDIDFRLENRVGKIKIERLDKNLALQMVEVKKVEGEEEIKMSK